MMSSSSVSDSADKQQPRRSEPAAWGWLVAILLLAAFFRSAALTTWDGDTNLHPDERFIIYTTYNLQIPRSFGDYFRSECVVNGVLPAARNPTDGAGNPTPLNEQEPSRDSGCNTLNPRNYNWSRFFVYGTLPTTLARLGVEAQARLDGQPLARISPEQVRDMGRTLSMLYDLGTVALLFFIGRRLYDRRVGLVASLLYALAAFPIQIAHFFTVDAATVFFTTLSIYWAVRIAQGGGWGSALGAGVSIGAAMACRITMATLGLAVAVGALLRLAELVKGRQTDDSHTGVVARLLGAPPDLLFAMAWRVALAGVVTILSFRIFQPDAFVGSSFFDIRPEPRFLDNIAYVGRLVSGEADSPPSQQWTQRAQYLFALQNMVVWGMSLPLGVAAWSAWGVAGWRIVRRGDLRPLIPWAWIGFYFAWQGGLFGQTMRYYLLLYGLLIILAAWGLVAIWDRARPLTGHVWRQWLWRLPLVIVVAGAALWAYAFTRIYSEPHSRIQASRWIYQNIPPGSAITFEQWDDPLPLGIDGQYSGQYVGISMAPYGEDDQTKYTGYIANDGVIVEGLLAQLDRADYLIYSSNRVYDSATRLPARYPALTRYYHHLFEGRLGFELVADIHSFPTLFGIEIPTPILAEEAFSVYDHPRVLIFRKTADYSSTRAVQLITGDVAWGEVYKVPSMKAHKTPTALRLTQEQWPLFRFAGDWARMFNSNDVANAVPWLVWLLALQALGLACFTLLFRLFAALPDRGYALSKTLGLLIVGYLAWFLASVGEGGAHGALRSPLLAFGKGSVLLCAALLIGAGLWAARSNRIELAAFWRRRRAAILSAEGLFLLVFFGFTLLRAFNPDLWHPARGGEKPMDLAFLTAVVKSPAFPPYDPWFAGGYLNYYYFGFVLVATLIHLTGVIPTTAYNLAVPTFAALTALGAWGAAFNLTALRGRLRSGGVSNQPLLRRLFDPLPGAVSAIWQRYEQRAIGAGLAAALFATLAGSLAQAVWFLPGTAAAPDPTLPEQCRELSSYAAQQDCRGRAEWAFWDATRLVGMSLQDSTINEFPFFTFLFADLHAHMIALPLTLAALNLILALVRHAPRTRWQRSWSVAASFSASLVLTLIFLALTIGALYATNTWDYPTSAGLGALGVGLYAWRRYQRGMRFGQALLFWGIASALLLLLARFLFLPFVQRFATEYAGFMLWDGTRTSTLDFLKINGLWLFLAGSAGLALAYRSGRFGLPVLAATGGGLTVAALAFAIIGMDALPLQILMLAAALTLLFDILVRGPLTRERHPTPAKVTHGPLQLTLPGLDDSPDDPVERSAPAGTTLLALVWGLAALGITLLTEVVVAKGDIGRMNSVFKFGMQSWLLFATVGGVALAWLWFAAESRRAPWLRLVWRGGAVVLVAAALVYPLTATPARLADRYDLSLGPTLDGMAFMRSPNSTWAENDRSFTFAEDAAAIDWMRANISGNPIVLETHLEAYRWGGRVSIYTGLPTLLGWPWHMQQQRSAADGGPIIAARQALIPELYNSADPVETLRLLRLYGVEYVYVGQLERAVYAAAGLAKFDALAAAGQIDMVYSAGETRIYRVPASELPPAVLTTSLPVRAPAPEPRNDLMLPVRVGDLPSVGHHGWNSLAANPFVAVALWLLAWYALAALGLPLAALVFGGRAPDGGWAWARLVGLLLLGYAVWLPVSARLWLYDGGGIALGLALTLALNIPLLAALGRRSVAAQPGADGMPPPLWSDQARLGARALGGMLRARWRQIAGIEALFIGAFGFLLALRWLNPDLWQPIWGGEKPFEFGFLNALIRSPVLPPYSPFYSDGIINYYYYGFFLASLPTRVTGIPPEIAYNLIVPTLFALMLTAVCALGLRARGSWALGLLGAALVGVAGNLAAVFPANWARGLPPVLDTLVANGIVGLGERLGDWFVGPTRVIPNTINEFPYFSFLFADLHPHTIALPLTVLMMTLVFEAFDREPGLLANRFVSGARWGLTVLTLGALAVTNSWDFPTYGLLLGGALLGRAWRETRHGGRPAFHLAGAAFSGIAAGAAALLLYLPFFQNFRAMVGGIALVEDTSRLGDFLLLYGVFLLPLLIIIFSAAWRLSTAAARRSRSVMLEEIGISPEATGLIARVPGGIGIGQIARVALALAGVLVALLAASVALAPLAQALGFEQAAALLALDGGLAASGLRVWLGMLLLVMMSLLFARGFTPRTWFAFWAVAVGIFVALLCEILHIRDHLAGGDWYRMNTVFKFGLQAWVLLTIALMLLLPGMLQSLRRRGGALQAGGYGLLAVLLALALVYPVVGTASRTAYRFPGNSTGGTLDGLAFMQRESFQLPAYLQPQDGPPITIALRYDGEAIRWLDEHIEGTPVVLQTSIEFYRSYGVRIAANTGFPTIVSPLHESEQRDPQAVSARDLDVATIFRTTDTEQTLRLLSRYRVGYVYVGPIERAVYGDAGMVKFQQMAGSFLEVAYQNDQVTIYQVKDNVYGYPMLPDSQRPAPIVTAPPVEPDAGEPVEVIPVTPADDTLRDPAVIEALEQQVAADPGVAGPAFELAERYRALGRFDEAAAVLEQAARANPTDIGLHHLWGDILIDARRYDEAVEAFRAAIVANPTAGNYNKLGLGLLDASRLGDAEQAFLQAIAIDPNEPDPYFHLGVIYETRGDERLAVQQYDKYIELAPDGPFAPQAFEALARLTP